MVGTAIISGQFVWVVGQIEEERVARERERKVAREWVTAKFLNEGSKLDTIFCHAKCRLLESYHKERKNVRTAFSYWGMCICLGVEEGGGDGGGGGRGGGRDLGCKVGIYNIANSYCNSTNLG